MPRASSHPVLVLAGLPYLGPLICAQNLIVAFGRLLELLHFFCGHEIAVVDIVIILVVFSYLIDILQRKDQFGWLFVLGLWVNKKGGVRA